MRLIILHGNGLVGTLNRVSQIKKTFDKLSVTELDFKQTHLKSLLLDLLTPQLFSDKRLVVVNNIDNEFDLEELPQHDQNLTIILRFTKALTSNNKILKNARLIKAEVILISEQEEVSVFPFLDKLAEKKVEAIIDFEKLYKNFGGQYLLTMFFYMLRRFILIPKNLPPFVLKKLEIQRRNFNEQVIKELYKQALETDYKIKNGLADERTELTLLFHKTLS